MKTYFECWVGVAAALFSQALAGEPELVESQPKVMAAGAFGWTVTLEGDVEGRFTIMLEREILEAPLVGEGVDQRAGWGELVRETANAAAGELLAASGKRCKVAEFEEAAEQSQDARAFQLRSGERSWTILVRDQVRMPEPLPATETQAASDPRPDVPSAEGMASPVLSPGLELLLDVELEATLRFGSREMPLGEILELGPGDVVELDRHVADPVDLIVGDKIVARGEVVLMNGNFGLRVTEVAAPRKRLESIRCLF
jgi:flagellar motor switch protein FliN/FliY